MEGILTALERRKREFHEDLARRTMTAGQLRQFLENFDSDEPVIIRQHYGNARCYIVETYGQKEPIITIEEVG